MRMGFQLLFMMNVLVLKYKSMKCGVMRALKVAQIMFKDE